MSYDQQAHQRIDEIEQILAERHPAPEYFLNSIRLRHGTEEEREQARQIAQQLAVESGAFPAQPNQETAQLRNSLAEALNRLAVLEETERKRNLAAELAARGKTLQGEPKGKPATT